MKKLVLALLVGLFSGAVSAEPELKGTPQGLRGFLHPRDNVVTIHGEAEETAYSDKAIVSVVITTKGKLLSEAISANSTLRKKLSTELIKAGLKQDAIKSSKFSSSPQYGWFGRKPASYEVVNRMAISIFEEESLKAIAVVADRYSEAELSDTAFEHSRKDEFDRQVKSKALDNVLKQKVFYEKSLGVKLAPIGIRDSDVNHQATRGAYALEEVVVTAQKRVRGLADVSSAQSLGQPAEPSFDEVRYQAEISVDFKIE